MRIFTYLSLVIFLVTSGCSSYWPIDQQTQIHPSQPPSTTRPSDSTMVPVLTQTSIIPNQQTMTITPYSLATQITLEPQKAKEAIRLRLNESTVCAAPCFWNITPGVTSPAEAKKVFDYLNQSMESIDFENKKYANVRFNDSTFSLNISLPIQNSLIESIQLTIMPNKDNVQNLSEWLVYSPEELLQQYGVPSRIDFYADWGPTSFFSMQLFFEDVDLIVQYAGSNIIPTKKGDFSICPLAARFDSIQIWLGDNPINAPHEGIPIETATTMTRDEFSELILGKQQEACLLIKGNVFK